MGNAYNILSVKYERRDHLEDVSIHGRIILEWILRKECGKLWTGCIRLRIGTSGGLL
jgi:hypothetical protein